MIDHISIPVSDLNKSRNFYTELLLLIGYKLLDEKPGTIGFGKRYPDFWLNERKSLKPESINDGFHVCLRASSVAIVNDFHETALKLGATSNGEPGLRPKHGANYYAAFIIDFDGNRIEVVTFI